MTSEVTITLKEIKNKVPGIHNLTNEFLMLGGDESVEQITNNSHQILKKIKMPIEWKEVKIIILHEKGDMRDNKNHRPVIYFPTCTNAHTDATKTNGKCS